MKALTVVSIILILGVTQYSAAMYDSASSKIESFDKYIGINKRGQSKNVFKEIKDSRLESCFFASSDGTFNSPYIFVLGNNVQYIGYNKTSKSISTKHGVYNGMNLNLFNKKMKNTKFEKVADEYDGPNTFYLILWDTVKKNKGYSFKVQDGIIAEIKYGYKEIMLQEGCA